MFRQIPYLLPSPSWYIDCCSFRYIADSYSDLAVVSQSNQLARQLEVSSWLLLTTELCTMLLASEEGRSQWYLLVENSIPLNRTTAPQREKCLRLSEACPVWRWLFVLQCWFIVLEHCRDFQVKLFTWWRFCCVACNRRNRKSMRFYQSKSQLEKKFTQAESKLGLCEKRATVARNEYLLSLAALNAHQERYYDTDVPQLMQVCDWLLIQIATCQISSSVH